MSNQEIDLELTGIIATHEVPPGFASWRSYVLGRGHDIVKVLRDQNEAAIQADTAEGFRHDSPEAAPTNEQVSEGALYLLRMDLMAVQLAASSADTNYEAATLLKAANQKAVDKISKWLTSAAAKVGPAASLVESGAAADGHNTPQKAYDCLVEMANIFTPSYPEFAGNMHWAANILRRAALAAASTDGGGPADSEWLRAGNLLYTLEHDHWRKGESIQRNRLMVTVNNHRSVPEEETESLINKIHTALAAPTSPVAGGAGPREQALIDTLFEVRDRLLSHSQQEEAHLIAVDLPELISLAIGPLPQPAAYERPDTGEPDLNDLPF